MLTVFDILLITYLFNVDIAIIHLLRFSILIRKL